MNVLNIYALQEKLVNFFISIPGLGCNLSLLFPTTLHLPCFQMIKPWQETETVLTFTQTAPALVNEDGFIESLDKTSNLSETLAFLP